jgi:hypothetical protein
MSFGLTVYDSAGAVLVDKTVFPANIVDIIDLVDGVDGSKSYPDHAGHTLAAATIGSELVDPNITQGGLLTAKASVAGTTVSWVWNGPGGYTFSGTKIYVIREAI